MMVLEESADQEVGFPDAPVRGAEAKAFEAGFAFHDLHAGLAGGPGGASRRLKLMAM
jgi:hypothetical protein